jgi:hypothetical protein
MEASFGIAAMCMARGHGRSGVHTTLACSFQMIAEMGVLDTTAMRRRIAGGPLHDHHD